MLYLSRWDDCFSRRGSCGAFADILRVMSECGVCCNLSLVSMRVMRPSRVYVTESESSVVVRVAWRRMNNRIE